MFVASTILLQFQVAYNPSREQKTQFYLKRHSRFLL